MIKCVKLKTAGSKTLFKLGNKILAEITSGQDGKYHVYIPFTAYSGIGRNFATFAEAVAGAKKYSLDYLPEDIKLDNTVLELLK